jgi:hypothetical protein
MKITIIEAKTKQPLVSTKIQFQIGGEFFSTTTDSKGLVELDDEYIGRQLIASCKGIQAPAVTASDGMTLTIDTTKTAVTEKGGVSGR